MQSSSNSTSAREAIFRSIRSNLAASAPYDLKEHEIHVAEAVEKNVLPPSDKDPSLVTSFKDSLEAVDGHCLVVQNELEVIEAITGIIASLQKTNLRARRIAISNAKEVERIAKGAAIDVDEITVAPSASEIFSFDLGISRAQAGIAETGTLLLDSSRERHRLVSLVPPVHIAIIQADEIVATLGEALLLLKKDPQLTPLATLVTGPSRTADIELTLAIGVHGPQELYVIVSQESLE